MKRSAFLIIAISMLVFSSMAGAQVYRIVRPSTGYVPPAPPVGCNANDGSMDFSQCSNAAFIAAVF